MTVYLSHRAGEGGENQFASRDTDWDVSTNQYGVFATEKGEEYFHTYDADPNRVWIGPDPAAENRNSFVRRNIRMHS